MNTYEEQQKQEIEKAQEVTKKVLSVIRLLGMKIEKDGFNESKWHVRETATNSAGEKIYFSSCKYEKWRITIDGGYPRNKKGEYIQPYKYGENASDKITVSANKTPEQIVKDIEKRFFPLYRERLAYVLSKINQSNEYERKCLDTMTLLSDHPLSKYEIEQHQVNLNFSGYGTVKVYNETVNIELSNVDIETANKIIALLPKRTEE